MLEYQVDKGPHIKNHDTTRKIMFRWLIALLPIILFSFYKNGIKLYIDKDVNFLGMFRPLIMIFIACIGSIISEFLSQLILFKKRDKELKKSMSRFDSFFPGLFLALMLPIHTPLLYIFIIIFITVILSNVILKIFKYNILNSALLSKVIILVCFSSIILNNGGYLNTTDIKNSIKNVPLTNSTTMNSIGDYQSLVKPYGNLWDFFTGNIPGTIGETSTILCLLAFLYLIIRKSIKWRIPLVYVSTVFVITWMIGGYHELGIWYPLFQILSGGLIFGAVFMATDTKCTPTTPIGQILYGLFLGIITTLIRYLTPFPELSIASVLIIDCFVILLDRVGAKARFDFHKSIWLFVLAWLLILVVGMSITLVKVKENPKNVEPNKQEEIKKENKEEIKVEQVEEKSITQLITTDFTVVEKDITNNIATYVVSQKAKMGDIKARIVINNGRLTTFIILDQHESDYQKLESENYVNKLVYNQDNLANYPDVEGAKETSQSVKKLVINTLKDYNNK